MPIKWVDEFCKIAVSNGLDCKVTSRVNGWPQTVRIGGATYFAKSVTYNVKQSLYFSGVDPDKLKESGEGVLICGGSSEKIRDVFIIPWKLFFETLEKGEPINTYQWPREYLQYKFKLKDRDGKWKLSVQGKNQPIIEVSNNRFSVEKAISSLKEKTAKIAEGRRLAELTRSIYENTKDLFKMLPNEALYSLEQEIQKSLTANLRPKEKTELEEMLLAIRVILRVKGSN